jgi:hypothetical protein
MLDGECVFMQKNELKAEKLQFFYSKFGHFIKK